MVRLARTADRPGLEQIEADPEYCRVWNIVAMWYEGKKCVFCQKAITPLYHIDHAPASLGPNFRQPSGTRSGRRSSRKFVRRISRDAGNCHVAETFRRLHPELVTHRPVERKRDLGSGGRSCC